MAKWVICKAGKGYHIIGNKQDELETTFEVNSVGIVKETKSDHLLVWLIGSDSYWMIQKDEVEEIDVTKTGDKFHSKICNICHCLKPVENFSRNQTNLHGILRRPSCQKCRTTIDKRSPKSRQAKTNGEKQTKSRRTIFLPDL